MIVGKSTKIYLYNPDPYFHHCDHHLIRLSFSSSFFHTLNVHKDCNTESDLVDEASLGHLRHSLVVHLPSARSTLGALVYRAAIRFLLLATRSRDATLGCACGRQFLIRADAGGNTNADYGKSNIDNTDWMNCGWMLIFMLILIFMFISIFL